jgi:hypothetical protein
MANPDIRPQSPQTGNLEIALVEHREPTPSDHQTEHLTTILISTMCR